MTEGLFSDRKPTTARRGVKAIYEALAIFQATDDAWGAELRRVFGKQAGDARYQPRGKGDAGSALRAHYEAREAARIAYDRTRGRDINGLPLP